MQGVSLSMFERFSMIDKVGEDSMARPSKSTINYFPHYIKTGKTLFVLENDFGNDGYAFWFKLLEVLGNTDGMFYEWNDMPNRRFLLSKTRVNEEIALNIIQALVDVEAIDRELWEQHGIIWCQNLVDNVRDAFKRRSSSLPKKPVFDEKNNLSMVSDDINPEQIDLLQAETGKGKEREKKGKEKENIFAEIIGYLNEKTGKRYSAKSEANKKLINGRIAEGRTLEDFTYVIDVKCSHWLDDTKMNEYLRPSTIFAQKNFENYLNQKPKEEPQRDKAISSRDKEAEFQQYLMDGGNPDEFDWT